MVYARMFMKFTIRSISLPDFIALFLKLFSVKYIITGK